MLRVYSNVIRDMRFTVFNQWGEKIFESSAIKASAGMEHIIISRSHQEFISMSVT